MTRVLNRCDCILLIDFDIPIGSSGDYTRKYCNENVLLVNESTGNIVKCVVRYVQ